MNIKGTTSSGKFGKFSFYSASAEIKPTFVLSTTFQGEYCLLRRKSSCWHQQSIHHFVLFLEHRVIESKSPNTHTSMWGFFACLTFQMPIIFHTFIQKWPSLKINLEVDVSLGQIVHWQNVAYSKKSDTNASAAFTLFLPHTPQCTKDLGCLCIFWRILCVKEPSVALLKLICNCWASTKGK